MNYDDKVLDFLAQPENLHISFQVAEYVEKLKEKTHQDFWPMFIQVMSERLDASEHKDDWGFVSLPPERWGKSWEVCHIRPSQYKHSNLPVLNISLQQGTPNNNFRLLTGICWTPEHPKEIASRSFDALVEQLREMNKTQSSEKWPGWNWLPYGARGEQFVMKMYNEPEELMDELSNAYWDFFISIRPYINDVMQESVARK